MVSPTDFLRLAVEPRRLAILGAAALGPVDAARLAEQLDVQVRDVLSDLVKLQEAGLIDESGRLDRAAMRTLGAQLPSGEMASARIVEGPWTAEETRVLESFFEGSRLAQIPTQHAKRLIVLERLAQEFEPGIRYPERQVNFMLQMFHRDYAALRRYLVDNGFLTRADGVYWRTGGRYVDAEQEENGQG